MSRHPQSINLKFGLNQGVEKAKSHEETQAAIKKRSLPSSSVLMGGDASDNDDNDLRAHQQALRRRAQRAVEEAKSRGEADIYDYDGSWTRSEVAEASANPDEPKKSKYIHKLLTTAQRRQHHLDRVRDQKYAREIHNEESQNEELQAKEKFVTSSYKRQLQERERWLDNDEEGSTIKAAEESPTQHDNQSHTEKSITQPSWMEGFEKTSHESFEKPLEELSQQDTHQRLQTLPQQDTKQMLEIPAQQNDEMTKKQERLALLRHRADKLAQLRQEYFLRMEDRGLSHLLSIN